MSRSPSLESECEEEAEEESDAQPEEREETPITSTTIIAFSVDCNQKKKKPSSRTHRTRGSSRCPRPWARRCRRAGPIGRIALDTRNWEGERRVSKRREEREGERRSKKQPPPTDARSTGVGGLFAAPAPRSPEHESPSWQRHARPETALYRPERMDAIERTRRKAATVFILSA